MESNNLFRFYEQTRSWPKVQSEIDELVTRISILLGASLVGVVVNFHNGIGVSNGIFRQGISTFLNEQLKSSQQKSTKLNSGEFSKFRLPTSHSLFPVRLEECLLFHFPVLSTGQSSEHGFLLAGFSKNVDPTQELLFAAVSQYMCDLTKVADLEEAVRIRNQFLSIASHELKTPLTSIYGILQLQERMIRLKKEKEETPLFPEQERHHTFLKMVIRQVERLNELIDGLLDISRIQNNRFMVEQSDADVADILWDCTQTRLGIIAKEAGVKLHVESAPHLMAWVDPVRMEEVINNLVMNAIRVSPEGGVIWIKLRTEEGAFRITIRDQGPSIPMEDREKIFQPFEMRRTVRMGGLGLGLFISRQIALLHGGNVSLIESVPGKGNVFEAYIPLRNSNRPIAVS